MPTVAECVEQCRTELEQADLSYGHGTDNAHDEAVWLVLHVMGRPLDGSFSQWEESVPASRLSRIRSLLQRRIGERRPLAYLLGEARFCGLRFLVDESVLVPRSPLGELIAAKFRPWLEPGSIRNALDMCTGSGCIAVAMACHLPDVRVDAADISGAALAIAERNVALHGVGGRVRLVRSDLFQRLRGRSYDLIVSNPPYVPKATLGNLPAEYSREPALGLAAGEDGLELVLRILAAAPAHLAPGGMLICEVGESAGRLLARLPSAAFTWLEFAHGGDGVFTIGRKALEQLAGALGRAPDPS